MRRSTQTDAGFSLIEVLVVLAILGTMSGVVLGWRSHPVRDAGPTDGTSERREIVEALEQASLQGRPITVTVEVAGNVHTVTAVPGGRLVGGGLVGADPLTGAWVR